MGLREKLHHLKIELPGNLAKVKVLMELEEHLEKGVNLKLLDIGCVGPAPLQFWEYILDNYDNLSFELYGVDLSGIKRAKRVVENRGWKNVILKEASGYDLSKIFPCDYFDIVVSTQVLEHIKHLRKFLNEIKIVTKGQGVIYFTLDSAHYPRKVKLKTLEGWKRIGAGILDILGQERYHDVPIYDYEIEPIFKELKNFSLVEKKFYNIHPLKEIHNLRITKAVKNNLLLKWLEYENLLNEDKDFIEHGKAYFLGLYYKVQKK